jgi:hypothetical protein
MSLDSNHCCTKTYKTWLRLIKTSNFPVNMKCPPHILTISSLYPCAGRQNPDSVEAVRPVAHEDRKSKGRVPFLFEVFTTVLETLSDSGPATRVFELGRNRERELI